MQIFYSQFFPENVVDKLKGLGYVAEPFKLVPSGNGVYELRGVPEELTGKTAFLVSSDNNHHGITYSLIKRVVEGLTSESLAVDITDAHLDWKDPLGKDYEIVNGWNFLSHVAELPPVSSIRNWGSNPEYEAGFDFCKKNGSNIRIKSSSTLPDTGIISKTPRGGLRYLSHDLDVIGSESIFDPALTGHIELKTSASDIIYFTRDFQPDFMDIYLNPDENAQNMQRYLLESDLDKFLTLLKGIYSEDKNTLQRFVARAEYHLETISSWGFITKSEIPAFLFDSASVDATVKNLLDGNEKYLKKLANHAYHSVPELCAYLLQAMDGRLNTDDENNEFHQNIDKNILSRLDTVSQTIGKIRAEKYYGDIRPLFVSHPEFRIFRISSKKEYFGALDKAFGQTA